MKRAKANRILLALLLLGVAVLCCSGVCFAAPTAGSITLDCAIHNSTGDIFLAGDEYTVVLIATAELSAEDETATYHTLPAYRSFDCDWGSLPASTLRQKAQALQKEAERTQAALARSTTGKDGRTAFHGLAPGMYLVFRSKTAAANAGYVCEPCLVAVPQSYPEGIVYDVTVVPKFSSAPAEDPKPGIPQTGQLKWPIPVLAVLGVSLLAVGFVLQRKRKDRK